MKEVTYNSDNQGTSKIKRAFGWIYLIRSFPKGSIQILDRDMIDNTISIFTEGHATCMHETQNRVDRTPGIFTPDSNFNGLHGNWTLTFLEDTSRICIPKTSNQNKLPNVKKVVIEHDKPTFLKQGFKGLICVGSLKIKDKILTQYDTFSISDDIEVSSIDEKVYILDFTHA